ncbi:hypothetical protein Vau01_014490 [Virgisporangium aurantiacum]|uniref:Uncharacterized protein n=2 Tax=Virgisporangium aurantiacum TaxID=175570 RepID=A0A8J3Z2Q0_9ACTN|nr:hypothetical protein Vau01_014490 [Virgisporangium aurantiacum]
MRRRLAALALAAALAGSVLAGCSSEGADVDCNLNSCTVTMDRGVDASASVLGVDVKLQSVQGQQVTLDVEGNTVTVPVGADGSTQVAGLTVTVQSITDDQVVLQVTGGN